METVCAFSITPLDRALAPPGTKSLLAKRVELDSRRRLPKLWALTDRLNRAERAPQAVQVRRRRRRSILGVLCWALGLFLLLPGLMEPHSLLAPLLTGAAAYGAGIAALWRHRRTLLGILSLLQGALLTFAGANSETLGRFLFLGIFGPSPRPGRPDLSSAGGPHPVLSGSGRSPETAGVPPVSGALAGLLHALQPSAPVHRPGAGAGAPGNSPLLPLLDS